MSPARPPEGARWPHDAPLQGCPAAFGFAFQPIVDAAGQCVVSYEALIRGPAGEPAPSVLAAVAPGSVHRFDAIGRVRALALAVQLGIDTLLNLNFLPQGLLLTPRSVESTLEAAEQLGWPVDRLVLEVTENEVIDDVATFARLLNGHRSRGLKVAIDDFGAGYSGLNLLAGYQPDQIKLDMALLRGIERSGPRQAIVWTIIGACADLGIDVIAEGVETVDEYHWLRAEGIALFQGYLFARPAFQALPPIRYPG